MTELQLSDYCWWDYVVMYDGSTTDSDVYWFNECGTDFETVTSSGSSVLVIFVSDESLNRGRFSLDWIFTDSDDDGDEEGGLDFIVSYCIYRAGCRHITPNPIY